MRMSSILSCIAILAISSVPSLSSDKTLKLTEVSGKVLVNTKAGVIAATLGSSVAEGTRVFVADDAIARIGSADGACDIALPPSKVTVINHEKLCAVQITPTATEVAPDSPPPPLVGLMFFSAAASVGILGTTSNNRPVSSP